MRNGKPNLDVAPEKPNQAELDLWSLGRIVKITSEFKFTSADDGETWWTLTNASDDELTMTDTTAMHYLDFKPGGSGNIAGLKMKYRKKVNAWNKFIEDNEREYAEYIRLARRFGKENAKDD